MGPGWTRSHRPGPLQIYHSQSFTQLAPSPWATMATMATLKPSNVLCCSIILYDFLSLSVVFQKKCFPVFSKQNQSGVEGVGNVSMGQKLGEPFHFTPKWRVFVDVQCAKNGHVLIDSLSCYPILTQGEHWKQLYTSGIY